ncbi:MAG: type VI secretion system-associated FHA domain protein TagH [Rhodospirillales bacterium]|nr:type VI secretion system-associated FHA domain protein TagH [Rhodospirillales bacterium]
MALTLTLSGARGASDQAARSIERGTLSIGRSAGNDWVLADPERLLSKTHCIITAAEGRYFLTDLSTNGVYLNGSPNRVPRNGQAAVNDGDEIRIGDYVLIATETAGRAAPPPHAAGPMGRGADPLAEVLTPDPLADPRLDPLAAEGTPGFAHPLSVPPPSPVRAHDPFDQADARHGTPAHDPDDDLFRGLTPAENWVGPSQADNADAAQHVIAVGAPVAVNNFDDLDIDALLGDLPPEPGKAPSPAAMPGAITPSFPLAAPRGPAAPPFPGAPGTPAPAGYRPSPPPPPADPFADPAGADLSPAAAPPPPRVAPPARPSPPPQPAPGVGSGMIPGMEAAFAPAAPAAASPFDEPEAPVPAPPVPTPVAPPAPVAVAAAPPPATADAARLLAAFLDGAGVADLALGADAEAAMRNAGTVFRVLVDGLRQVLMSRAAIKNEFRVEQTMLRARDNNALKFAVTVEDAIAALLLPAKPGYKAPLASAKEAFDDVRAHEMAVMAGVQTALLGLLKRFEPGALESRLQPGVLGNLLPAARKARTWELFCATYKDIAREAEDDFQSVFGREFARAYDAQIRKL